MKADPLPSPQVTDVSDALAVPVQPGPDAPHGVFDADDRFCEPSRMRLSRGRRSATPDWVAPVHDLPGHHLYAGMARLHFGHFLVESFARVWALETAGPEVEHILLLPFSPKAGNQWVTRKYGSLWSAVSGGRSVHVLRKPTRIERLSVPTQGFGHDKWLNGTPAFRGFVRTRLGAAFAPDGPERLYISRSGLKDADKQVDGEAHIEEALETAGYTIFHPEQHSLDVQCARYAAARQIVGADGSAFHLLPFMAHPQAQVAIYLRRNRPVMLRNLRRQLTGFTGIEPVLIDARVQTDPPSQAPTTPLDTGAILSTLSAQGFL